MKWYRLILVVAAAYNVSFGIWAGFFPLGFFRWFQLELPRYPSVWACLGMVIGLYGIGYAYEAWRPGRAAIVVAIGLVGKVLGPIGWLLAVSRHELPCRTFPLILANDLIWWFPFFFYLSRNSRMQRLAVAWICALIHVISCVGLLVVRGGTELQPDVSARVACVSDNTTAWVAVWVAWSLSSMSLLAFLVAWSSRLTELGAGRLVPVAGTLLCAIGLFFDLWGEAVNVVRLTRPGLSVQEFERAAREYAILSAGIANGLYCIAGLALSTVAWRVGQLRGWPGSWGFVMWVIGLGLTLATVPDNHTAMIVTAGGVMVIFIPWVVYVGQRMQEEVGKVE